jgi:hypothetical protein
MRALANFVLGGRLQAILVTVASALLASVAPPYSLLFSYLGAALIALVTLRVGVRDGLIVLGGSIAAIALVSLLMAGQAMVVVMSAFLLWSPCWIVAAVLRHTVSLPLAMQSSALIGVIALVGIYLLYGDPAPWWLERLTPFGTALMQQGGVEMDEATTQAVLRQIAQLMTGAFLATLVLGVIGSLLLARWWQGLLFNPGGFRQEFHNLRFDRWMGLVTLGLMLLSELNEGILGSLTTQVVLVLMMLYFFAGLATMHGVVALSNAGTGWLVAMYITLLVPQISGVLLVVLSGLGLLDTWIDIRRRFRERQDRRQ